MVIKRQKGKVHICMCCMFGKIRKNEMTHTTTFLLSGNMIVLIIKFLIVVH